MRALSAGARIPPGPRAAPRWTLKAVADGQKLLRVDVQGDTLYGFRVRGTDFTVTGIKSVRASGGPAPQCSVTGSPATLACDGALPGGISVFVQLTTSGSGGAYELGFLLSPGDTNLLYIPSNERAPPVPLGGSIGRTSNGGGRVTIRNPGSASFQQLEVAPIGFRVAGVSTADCGRDRGRGHRVPAAARPARSTAVIHFSAALPEIGSAYLFATGTDTGIAYVEPGEACPDMVAALERLTKRGGDRFGLTSPSCREPAPRDHSWAARAENSPR